MINRGNYRRDVFASPCACEPRLSAMGSAVGRRKWRLHAYVLMRNEISIWLGDPGAECLAYTEGDQEFRTVRRAF